MPEPNIIEEQIQLERDQIKQGLKRLRDNTINLENKNYHLYLHNDCLYHHYILF